MQIQPPPECSTVVCYCYYWLVHKSCLTLSQSHELQPIRLPCLWDFPGKNTWVGCHFLLHGIFLTQGPNLLSYIGRRVLYHWATREASIFWGGRLLLVQTHVVQESSVVLLTLNYKVRKGGRLNWFKLRVVQESTVVLLTLNYKVKKGVEAEKLEFWDSESSYLMAWSKREGIWGSGKDLQSLRYLEYWPEFTGGEGGWDRGLGGPTSSPQQFEGLKVWFCRIVKQKNND